MFGSYIIHILYKECAKIKKKFRRQKVNLSVSLCHVPCTRDNGVLDLLFFKKLDFFGDFAVDVTPDVRQLLQLSATYIRLSKQ